MCKPLEYCNIDLKSRSQVNFFTRFDFTRKTRDFTTDGQIIVYSF